MTPNDIVMKTMVINRLLIGTMRFSHEHWIDVRGANLPRVQQAPNRLAWVSGWLIRKTKKL